MRHLMLLWLLALSLLATLPARAEWMEASSDHFVVYTDDNERDVRRFSEQLERYHSALVLLTGTEAKPPSPSNRVTVYVVRNERIVRELHGGRAKYVNGFYLARAGSSLAIVPEVNSGIGKPTLSMLTLLHEYAHHFTISSSTLAMPRWLSEGGAEFFAASSFEADGALIMGRAAQHRAGELFLAPDVRVVDLLDPSEYERRPKRDYDAFYGKSWLLYHFLICEPSRADQMERYISLLAEGKGQREAGLGAFGDFEVLERDLDRYLRRNRIQVFKLQPHLLQAGTITIRKLSAGEAAMMPVRIRSRRGVNDEQAKAVLVEARAVASRFPGDPAVLSALAEAEFDADNDREAIAAADPGQVNAYVQKGFALFSLAESATDAKDRETAYARARAPFIALNRRENDHPLPLIFYYRSFADQGAEPPPVAIDGLVRAMQLAPFDFDLRMTVGIRLIASGRQQEARIALKPVAFDPHGSGLAEAARKLLERLDREPGWTGGDLSAVIDNVAGDPD